MTRFSLIVASSLLFSGCEPSTVITTNISNPAAPTPVIIPAATQPVTTTPCQTTPNCPQNPTNPNPTRVPEIFRFDADSLRVNKNAGTILHWEVLDPNANVRIDPYPGSVGPIGFFPIFPNQTTTYTLTARNSVGAVQRSLIITVFVSAD